MEAKIFKQEFHFFLNCVFGENVADRISSDIPKHISDMNIAERLAH